MEPVEVKAAIRRVLTRKPCTLIGQVWDLGEARDVDALVNWLHSMITEIAEEVA